MAKKLVLLAVAIAALAAMAIPASASALTLTDSSGKVKPGEWLVGTSTSWSLTNAIIPPTCVSSPAEFAAEVQTNSGTLITAIDGIFTNMSCVATIGGEQIKISFTEPRLKHLETSSSDAGNASLSFTVDLGAFKCPYGGTVGFTYATGPTQHTIALSGLVTSSLKFCEEEEEGEGEPTVFEGTYSMSTTSGSQVWIEPGA